MHHFETEEKTLPCLFQTGEGFSSVSKFSLLWLFCTHAYAISTHTASTSWSPARLDISHSQMRSDIVSHPYSGLGLWGRSTRHIAVARARSYRFVSLSSPRSVTAIPAGSRMRFVPARYNMCTSNLQAGMRFVPARYKFVPRIYKQECDLYLIRRTTIILLLN